MTRRGGVTAAVSADGTTRAGLRRLYAAVIATGLGEGVFWIALVSLLESEARFELLLTAAVVARLAPRALFSYVTGRVLDRSNVRTVLIASEALRGLVFVALTGAVTAGTDAWVVLLGLLASAVLGVPARPSVMAVLPRMSGETNLAAAAATLSTIRQLVAFAGPLLGVAVVQLSLSAGFAVYATTFLFSAVLLATIRGVRWPEHGATQRSTASLGTEPPSQTRPSGLAGLIGLVGGMYMVRGAEMVLYVLVVTELLGAPAASLGFLAGGAGVGAVLAAPVATRVIARLRPATTLASAVVLTAVPTALLTVVGTVLSASAATAVVGAAMVLFEVTSVLTLQRVTPDGQLGTVFGAVDQASNAGMLVGALLVPGLVLVAGVDGALAVVAMGIGVVYLITAAAVARVGRVAAERLEAIEPTVDVLAQVGLFEEAPRLALERLAAAAEEQLVARGTTVVRQGEPADDLWVVRGGDLEVAVDGERINVVGTNGWFGEIGLVEHVPRTATVRTLTPATLLRIPGAVFLDVLADGAASPGALLDGIATRSARGRAR